MQKYTISLGSQEDSRCRGVPYRKDQQEDGAAGAPDRGLGGDGRARRGGRIVRLGRRGDLVAAFEFVGFLVVRARTGAGPVGRRDRCRGRAVGGRVGLFEICHFSCGRAFTSLALAKGHAGSG